MEHRIHRRGSIIVADDGRDLRIGMSHTPSDSIKIERADRRDLMAALAAAECMTSSRESGPAIEHRLDDMTLVSDAIGGLIVRMLQEQPRGGAIYRTAPVAMPRRAIVNVTTFWSLARQLTARIESGPHGEFIVLLTANGPLYVVPSLEIEERVCRFE